MEIQIELSEPVIKLLLQQAALQENPAEEIVVRAIQKYINGVMIMPTVNCSLDLSVYRVYCVRKRKQEGTTYTKRTKRCIMC